MAIYGTARIRGMGLGRPRKKNPYGPGTYKPPLPPAGSFDPALNAARAAAHRGLLDTRQDTELGLSRAGQDYSFGVEDIHNRGLEEEQDYTRNTQLLQRSFNILAGQQAERQRVALGGGGGAALQAAAKRRANQAIQQQGLNTAIARARAANQSAIGRLGVGYNRQVTDFGSALSRAEREDTQFGLDTDVQKTFQATQQGWDPPLPKNVIAANRAKQRAMAAQQRAIRRARGRRRH